MNGMAVAYVGEILVVKQMFEFTVKLNLRKGCLVLITRKDELLFPAPFSTKQQRKRSDENTLKQQYLTKVRFSS